MSVLVLALIFVVVCLMWCWRPRSCSPPKYPGALPIIGHIPDLLRNLNDLWSYYKEICDYMIEHDGCISLQVGPQYIYVVCDPEDAGVIANKCFEKSYHYKFANKFIKNGLLLTDPAKWKVHRKILNPAFNPLVLNTYTDEMNVQARNLVSSLVPLAGKGPVNIKGCVTDFVLKLICRTSLGLKAEDQEMIAKDYAKAIDEISKVYNKRGFNVWLYPTFIYKLSALKRKEQELITRIENIINPVIQKRRSYLQNKYTMDIDEYSSTSHVKRKLKPLLDLLLHLGDEEHVFSDIEIKEHLNTFVLASYDTTSAVLRDTMLILGTYPDVQERFYKEVMEVFQNEDIDKNDLPKLVYSEAVIKEVLRLYPPVPFVARNLQTDVVLSKYTLRAGNTCALSLYDLNRHSSWGPDAREFNPDRWLNPDTLPKNPNAFAGFSIGKRNCIGKKYAMMTLKTTLAYNVRQFHISADITRLKWKMEVILKPTTPALMTLSLRS